MTSGEAGPLESEAGEVPPETAGRASSSGRAVSDGRPAGRAASAAVWIGAAALAAVLVRLLAWGLPIEGDAVAYGALGRSLASGEGYAIDGVAHDRYPPGHPALLALALLLGGTVTATSRALGIVEGAAIAGLLVSLVLRLGRGRAPLLATIALSAAHPSLALFAGGLVVGSEGTALVVLLLATRLALAGERPRRAALVLTGLLPTIRYDLVAFPLVAAVLALRATSGRPLERLRAALPTIAVLGLPLLAVVVRTLLVSGRLFGAGYASHGLDLARVPGNLLVLLGLVLPAAGLGLLWIHVPRGLATLWRARREDRPVVRAALVGAVVHLALVALFAGPTYAGGGSLSFSSGSLRFGLAALPAILLAGLVGLGARPARARDPVPAILALAAPLLAVWLLSGSLQRTLPGRAQAAGRLHLLAEAFDAAEAEAAPPDWIALDLARRTNAGVEVFLGDRAPNRRVGVVAAARVPAGVFPRATELPLRDELGTARCWVVSDLAYEGVVFTAERPDLGRGGQGLFQRIPWKEIPGGSAGSYTIHQVIRPPR